MRVAVINAALGYWYPRGQKRLKESLENMAFKGDFIGWTDEWPNNNYEKKCPYNVKAAAFEQTIQAGYDIIIWLDCSVWACKPIDKIIEIIQNEGYYFWRSGYNCAQTCSDACINYFGVNRDKAETFHDSSTSMFGINMNHPQGKEFINRWIQAAKDGVFHGSREHDNQSADPRFMFHRQDQSAASMLIGLMGLKMYDPGIYSMYDSNEVPESVILLMRGM